MMSEVLIEEFADTGQVEGTKRKRPRGDVVALAGRPSASL